MSAARKSAEEGFVVQVGIYLDAQASTPVAPEALDALIAQLLKPGNPHSPHAAGAYAYSAIEQARSDVADLIGAAPSEITFTSGATEANNLAILGLAKAALSNGVIRRKIVMTSIEHPSVLEAVTALEAHGFQAVVAPVSVDGRVDLERLGHLIDQDTLLVCVMAANNVTGVQQPVVEVATLARAAGALVHCDAAQSTGRVGIDVFNLDVDTLSLSAHKMYGPPGVGALFVSATSPLQPLPLTFGGGQERGLRPGTVPAALIAAFGAAVRLVAAQRQDDEEHTRHLRALFDATLAQLQVQFVSNGSDSFRLPGSANISILGVDAQELAERLSSTLCISTGSACSSGQITVSPVLKAMNIPDSLSRSAIRLCFHRYSTEADAIGAATSISAAALQCGVATGSVVQ
jgi:cysteine desulfurase